MEEREVQNERGNNMYGQRGYQQNRVFNSKPFPDIPARNIKTCPACGVQVSMQWSTQKFKEYPTEITQTTNGPVTKRNAFHKCAGKPQGAVHQHSTTLNAQGIYDLFAKAQGAGLKFPKIRLLVPGVQLRLGAGAIIDPKDEVVLAIAGVRSKTPGQIKITDGQDYPSGVLYGYIDTAGIFNYRLAATREVLNLLIDLSKDPAGVAAKYGQLTGNCCFCGRALDDERSTKVGYGRVCAQKFGLAWGARP